MSTCCAGQSCQDLEVSKRPGVRLRCMHAMQVLQVQLVPPDSLLTLASALVPSHKVK